jgi:hypothetical protein
MSHAKASILEVCMGVCKKMSYRGTIKVQKILLILLRNKQSISTIGGCAHFPLVYFRESCVQLWCSQRSIREEEITNFKPVNFQKTSAFEQRKNVLKNMNENNIVKRAHFYTLFFVDYLIGYRFWCPYFRFTNPQSWTSCFRLND